MLLRPMSVYSSHFVDPVFKKKKQAEMFESGEAVKMAHVPIKAARNNDSSSIFHDDLLSKFTNYIMKGGQKQLARNLIERCFENIKRIQLEKYNRAQTEEEKSKIETNPLTILHLAIENSRPRLYITPIKRGGVKYQVPVPITEKHSYFRACKWMVEASREKETRQHLPEKMAFELIDAASNQGRVVKRKQDLHRLCEANRAYAHYRWS
jgi:small subunit ribosomal protein S7